MIGLLVLVVASVTDAILDRNLDDYDDSGWRYVLFVVVLVGYLSAGYVAGRRAPRRAHERRAGGDAHVRGVGARAHPHLAARDEHEALFTGTDPVFKPGQIFGHLVIASALGMLGGIIGARLVAKRAE